MAVEADYIAGKMKHKEIGYRNKGMHFAYSSEVVVAVPEDAAVHHDAAIVVAKAMEGWSGIAVQPCLPKHLTVPLASQKIEACREVEVR